MPTPKRKPRFRRYRKGYNVDARRVHAELHLTRDEIQQLEARAATEHRSIASYVSHVVLEYLKAPRRKRHRPTLANPLGRSTDRRVRCDAQVWLTPEQREELETRALSESRSAANYIGTLVLRDLRRAR